MTFFEILTYKENEMLQPIAEGTSIKQISLELHISAKTVKANQRRIMEKLGLHCVVELTEYAVGGGITTLEL